MDDSKRPEYYDHLWLLMLQKVYYYIGIPLGVVMLFLGIIQIVERFY